jgi:hypothetical protein
MTRKNPIVVLIMIVGKASFWNIYSGLTSAITDGCPWRDPCRERSGASTRRDAGSHSVHRIVSLYIFV